PQQRAPSTIVPSMSTLSNSAHAKSVPAAIRAPGCGDSRETRYASGWPDAFNPVPTIVLSSAATPVASSSAAPSGRTTPRSASRSASRRVPPSAVLHTNACDPAGPSRRPTTVLPFGDTPSASPPVKPGSSGSATNVSLVVQRAGCPANSPAPTAPSAL